VPLLPSRCQKRYGEFRRVLTRQITLVLLRPFMIFMTEVIQSHSRWFYLLPGCGCSFSSGEVGSQSDKRILVETLVIPGGEGLVMDAKIYKLEGIFSPMDSNNLHPTHRNLSCLASKPKDISEHPGQEAVVVILASTAGQCHFLCFLRA
jgi:hypothetical protein